MWYNIIRKRKKQGGTKMKITILTFIETLNELIDEGILEQFDEMTDEIYNIVCEYAKIED